MISSISFNRFLGIYTVLTLILFGFPAFHLALAFENARTVVGASAVIAFVLLQIVLMNFLMRFVALFGAAIVKAVALLLWILNLGAIYVYYNYGIQIDDQMIGNIFETDFREILGFVSPLQIIAIFAAVIAVGWLVSKVSISLSGFRRRLLAFLFSILIFLAFAAVTSPITMRIDSLAQRAGNMSLPWSYVFNTIRYYRLKGFYEVEQSLLPDGSFARPVANGAKDVVVLVIGESARRNNHSLFGYQRETNPKLLGQGVIPIDGAVSCNTNTRASLACILSHEGKDANTFPKHEPLPSYLFRHGVEVLWRTNNDGEPPLKATSYTTLEDIVKDCTEDCPDTSIDEALLYKLGDRIASAKSNRVFVVLHLWGSHGTDYFNRYPANFEKFTPVCKTFPLLKCSQEELANVYDNTILYTDHIISETIDILKGFPSFNTALVYVSDHGESLGEDGLYLHSMPKAIAPANQRDVPLLLWMSPAYASAYKIDTANIPRTVDTAPEYVFNTILGAFGLHSKIYQSKYDLLAVSP